MSFESTPDDDLVVQDLDRSDVLKLLREYANKHGHDAWSFIQRAMLSEATSK